MPVEAGAPWRDIGPLAPGFTAFPPACQAARPDPSPAGVAEAERTGQGAAGLGAEGGGGWGGVRGVRGGGPPWRARTGPGSVVWGAVRPSSSSFILPSSLHFRSSLLSLLQGGPGQEKRGRVRRSRRGGLAPRPDPCPSTRRRPVTTRQPSDKRGTLRRH